MPRFVLLHHRMPENAPRPSHWDLMLESGDTLRTWALEQMPADGQPVAAQKLADHRPAYLDYEGPVSGGRGHVTACDRGVYSILAEAEGRIEIQLAGEQLSGVATLTQIAGGDHWRVVFSSDGSVTDSA